MSTPLFLIMIAAFFVVQMALCIKGKRRLVRLMPVIAVFVAQVFFVVCYAASAWTNWAFLILLLLSMGPMVACALAWTIWGIVKKVK